MTIKKIHNTTGTNTGRIKSAAKKSAAINITDGFKKTGTESLNLIQPHITKKTSKSALSETILSGKIRAQIKKEWEIDLGIDRSTESLTPVLKNDGIYINGGGFTRKISHDGKQMWETETGASGYATPTFDNEGNLYVIGKDNIISLDRNGNERWNTTIGKRSSRNRGASHAPMLARDGNIYVCSDDHELHCFDPKTGERKWKTSGEGLKSRTPFMDKHGVLHMEGSPKRSFEKSHLKLDAKNSTRMREFSRVDVLHPTLVDDDGNQYLFKNGKYRVTAPDGKEKWSADLPGETTSTHHLFGPKGNLFVWVRNESLLSFTKDGKERFRIVKDQQNEPLSHDIAWDKDGTFYITGEGANWKLYAFNPDGAEKWTHKEPKHMARVKVGPDGTVFTGDNMDHVKGFDPKTGRRIFDHETDLAFGDSYQVSKNNDLVYTTGEGKMVKVHISNKEEVISERLKKAEEKERRKDGESTEIKQGDGFIVIGGVQLDVNRNYSYTV